jgi:hypothetical protein
MMAAETKRRERLFILFILVAFVALVELLSFFASKYLAKAGVFYDSSILKQNYDVYLRVRDPYVGWPESDKRNSTRFDPNFPSGSKPCVSVFGDSFTFSDEVADADAWPAVLGNELGCYVANYGVGGYGSDQAFLRYRSLPAEGKIVILSHLSENILRNINQFRNLLYPSSEFGLKPRFRILNGELNEVGIPDIAPADSKTFAMYPQIYLTDEYFLPDGPAGIGRLRMPYSLGILKALFSNYHLKAKFADFPRHLEFYADSHPSHGMAVTSKILSKFAETARSRGQVPMIGIIPTCGDFEYFKKSGEFPYSTLVAELRRAQLNYVDFGLEMISKIGHSDPKHLYGQCNAHFNKAGYRLLAEIFKERISADAAMKPLLDATKR